MPCSQCCDLPPCSFPGSEASVDGVRWSDSRAQEGWKEHHQLVVADAGMAALLRSTRGRKEKQWQECELITFCDDKTLRIQALEWLSGRKILHRPLCLAVNDQEL